MANEERILEMLVHLTQEVTGIKDELVRQSQEISGVKSEITGIRQEIAENRQEIADIRLELTEIRQDIAEIRQDIIRIEAKADETRELFLELEAKNAQRHVEMTIAIERLQKDRSKVEELTEKNIRDISQLRRERVGPDLDTLEWFIERKVEQVLRRKGEDLAAG